jgi:hypothetical protein
MGSPFQAYKGLDSKLYCHRFRDIITPFIRGVVDTNAGDVFREATPGITEVYPGGDPLYGSALIDKLRGPFLPRYLGTREFCVTNHSLLRGHRY